MLQDIQIISNGGLPLLQFNQERELDDTSFLQAGFLTAVSAFAAEVNNGELRLIETDQMAYLLKKSENFSTVFFLDELQEDFDQDKINLDLVHDYVVNELGEEYYSPADMNKEKNSGKITRINDYVAKLNLQSSSESLILKQSLNMAKKLEGFLYSSVGYIPGQCNIGKEGRYMRLTLGLVALIASLAIFILMVAFEVPFQYRALLYFTNVGAFVGILQYYHKFCVYNGSTKQYVMN